MVEKGNKNIFKIGDFESRKRRKKLTKPNTHMAVYRWTNVQKSTTKKKKYGISPN